jgi:hypothetical protein
MSRMKLAVPGAVAEGFGEIALELVAVSISETRSTKETP